MRTKTRIMLGWKLGSVLIMITAFSNDIWAQDTLSFLKCMERMFQNNLRIKQQQNIAEGYSLNVKKAKDARLPSLNAGINASGNYGRGIDPSTNTYVNRQFNNFNGGLNGDIVLFNGFYHINNIKLQKQDLSKNESEVQKIKNDLLIELSMRYTNVLYLQEQIRNIEGQIRLSNENIDQTQKRIDAGAIAKREIYRVLAQRDNEELNLINIKNTLDQNLLEIKLLINEDPAKTMELSAIDILPRLIATKEIKGEERKYQILQFPSLQAAKIEYEKSKTRMAMAKSGFYPTLSLGTNLSSAYSSANPFFGFSEQLDNNRSLGININAQIPIFNRNQTRNSMKEAELNQKNSGINYTLEQQNAYRTMQNAVNNLNASQKKYYVSQSALKSQQMNYEADKIRLEAGRIGIQEINISKVNYFNSLLALTKDKYEWIYNALVIDIYEGKDIAPWFGSK